MSNLHIFTGNDPIFQSDSDLEKKINKALDFILLSFPITFREGQREAIVASIGAILNPKYKNVIIEAPTGTGKSIISMYIALTLSEMNQSGYIITPEIFLQNQYENDIKSMGLPIPVVTGMDNYKCSENGLSVRYGYCNTQYNKPRETLDCYRSCEYYVRRDAAIRSKIALLNNAFWTGVADGAAFGSNGSENKNNFSIRDFTIFDECHKVDESIRNFYSPELPEKFSKRLEKFIDVLTLHLGEEVSDEWTSKYQGIQYASSKVSLKNALIDIQLYLNKLQDMSSKVKSFLDSNKNENIDDNYQDLFPVINDIRFFNSCIKRLLSVIGDDADSLVRYIGKSSITITTTKLPSMMSDVFSKLYKKGVFLTATPGSPKNFCSYVGIPHDTMVWIRFNSDFKWENCNINIAKPGFKMSKEHYETNLPKMINAIDAIVEKYPNQRGIIHTVSFNLTQAIMEKSKYANNRMKSYKDTEGKVNLVEKLLTDYNDTVVVGPSITEGIDLPDDKCRFQIFAKIPYLNLGDEFVQKMSKEHPEWYEWKTVLQLLQGSGRAIRHKNDYADTWILDGSAEWFLSKASKNIPNWWANRVKKINI
jgi:Rad3-related DNA helicase